MTIIIRAFVARRALSRRWSATERVGTLRRLSRRPGARCRDGGGRGRGRTVLAALARAVGPRARQRQRLSGSAGRRPRTCSGRPPFRAAATRRRSCGATASSSRPRTKADGGCRCSRFDRADGTRLWETFAPEGRSDCGSHFKNGHASATPATDGERVYVSFGTRGLLALDMNGKVVWHRDLGQMDAYHGTAGSPLLYKDRIILYQDQYAGLVHRRVRHADRASSCGGPAATRRSDGGRRSRSASAITTRSS